MSAISLQKQKPFNYDGQVMAYHSEADTLWVSPDNQCISCHFPHNTHQRYTFDTQLTMGPNVGIGGNIGVSLSDSSKATLNFGANFGIGLDMTITERSKAGSSEMPVIQIGFDGSNDSSQDSLQFFSTSPDNTKVGN